MDSRIRSCHIRVEDVFFCFYFYIRTHTERAVKQIRENYSMHRYWSGKPFGSGTSLWWDWENTVRTVQNLIGLMRFWGFARVRQSVYASKLVWRIITRWVFKIWADLRSIHKVIWIACGLNILRSFRTQRLEFRGKRFDDSFALNIHHYKVLFLYIMNKMGVIII